jgi:NCS1 family nucleobase:cation symporter-1
MTTVSEKPGKIEQHTIFQIPLDQRHGRARDLFTIWFGTNLHMLTIVTGALATTVFKLPFPSAVLAMVIGNLVGAVFMALHAAQGPRLGVPQMVQTRGQFGSHGAMLVVGIVIVMYVGFLAANIVLAGKSLHAIAPVLNQDALLTGVALVTLVATIFGHDLIHAYARWVTWVSGGALLTAFGWIVFVHGLPPGFLGMGEFSLAGFCSVLSISALWQIAYAPYVSDYSRYMPRDTGAEPAFWASYWGCTLGSVLPMTLGAMLGLIAVGGDVIVGLTTYTGAAAAPIIVILSISIAGNNAVNLYCGVLSTITVAQTFVPSWQAGALARTVTAVVLLAVALALALFSAANFMQDYTDFMLLLLYVLVPWTAVNLVDYYLVRHGDYDVDSFFAPDGGVYGRYNKAAIFCYLFGIAIQFPFVDNPLYTGPIAKLLSKIDISWIVGLAVVSPLYYLLVRRTIPAGNGSAAAAGQRA